MKRTKKDVRKENIKYVSMRSTYSIPIIGGLGNPKIPLCGS